jgi:WD40 repeat protein
MDGIDCRIDQYEPSPKEGWPRWCRNQVQEAKFVLIVCTQTYRERFDGESSTGTGLGGRWEGFIITQLVYQAESKNSKFIPLLFSQDDAPYIPLELSGVNRYDINAADGYEQLFRRLTNQPLRRPPDVAPNIKRMPTRDSDPIPVLSPEPPPSLSGEAAETKHEPEAEQPPPIRKEIRRRILQRLDTFTGHSGYVNAIAVTPDGQRAVSASEERILSAWELRNGHEVLQLVGHTDNVNGVAITPDGKHVVSASDDTTLKVWDLARGDELKVLTGHKSAVLGVAVTPDGKRAVSASADHTLKVWNLEAGRKPLTLAGHTDSVTAVSVTPDGQRAVSASYDETLKLWDLAQGSDVGTLIGHKGYVTAVAVMPDGKHAISSSADHTLKVWDLDDKRELDTIIGHTNVVTAVALTPDGKIAVSTSFDKTLKVWDLGAAKLIATATCGGRMLSCAFSQAGQLIIAGGKDGRIYVFHLEL